MVIMEAVQSARTSDLLKIGFCAATGAAVVYWIKSVHDRLTYHPFPGPRGGLLGVNIPRVGPEPMEEIFRAYTDAQCSPVSLRVKGMLCVLLGDMQDVRENLKPRPVTLRRNQIFTLVFDTKPGCPGLFTAEGEEWKRQRRAYASALTSMRVHDFLPIMFRKTAILMQQFESQGMAKNIGERLDDCFTDFICEAALGMELNYMEGFPIGRATTKERFQFKTATKLRFRTSARELIADPLLAFIATRLPRWFACRWEKIRVCYERGETCTRIAGKWLRRKYLEIKSDRSKARENCLMDQALLNMLDEGPCDAWSEQQMLDTLNTNFFTFFLAGSETASSTTAWLVYFLCKHPEWQERCRRQVLSVLDGAHWSSFSAAQLKELTVLRACLNECMRMSPAVPMQSAEVNSDDYFVRGQHVPRGTIVFFLTRFASTESSGLTDPLAFRPERWIDAASGKLRSESEVGNSILGFGAGPRMCPGRQLGEMEVLVTTAASLATFPVWSMQQKAAEVKRQERITVKPNPLGVRFKGGGCSREDARLVQGRMSSLSAPALLEIEPPFSELCVWEKCGA